MGNVSGFDFALEDFGIGNAFRNWSPLNVLPLCNVSPFTAQGVLVWWESVVLEDLAVPLELL